MSNDDKYFLKWFRIVQIFVLTFILISKNLLQDIFKDDRDKTTKNCIFQFQNFIKCNVSFYIVRIYFFVFLYLHSYMQKYINHNVS